MRTVVTGDAQLGPIQKLDSRKQAADPLFQNRLVLQSGAFQKAPRVVAIAKAGGADRFPLSGGSLIANPDGKIMVDAKTEDDELIFRACDPGDCQFGKKTIFILPGTAASNNTDVSLNRRASLNRQADRLTGEPHEQI